MHIVEKSKDYLTADEIAVRLGVSNSHAYKLISKMNSDLKQKGYLVVAGKISKKYFSEKFYGF